MKKLMTLMLAFSFLAATATTMFGQEKTEKTAKKKGKKGKKKAAKEDEKK